MPPKWTAAEIALYDQEMAKGADEVDRLVLMLQVGAERKTGDGVRGGRQAAADVLVWALRTYGKDKMGQVLTAAVLRIARMEEENAARDGRVRFELLDRVSHVDGVAVAGDRTLSPDATVVALLDDEIGILYDDAQDPGRPATRYTTMHPRVAARYLTRTGLRARLPAADLALLDGILPARPAAAVRAAAMSGAPEQAQPAGPGAAGFPQASPGPPHLREGQRREARRPPQAGGTGPHPQ